MRARGACYDHPGHLGIGQRVIDRHHLGADLPRQARGGVALWIDHILQREGGMSSGVARVNRADPAGAEEGDVEHQISLTRTIRPVRTDWPTASARIKASRLAT